MNMKRILRSLFILLIVFSGLEVFTQTTMNIHLDNGTIIQIPINTIDSITYTYNEGNLPVVETSPIAEIKVTMATGGGLVVSQGDAPVTQRGICWSTNTNPTITDNFTNNGVGMGSFVSEMQELNENQTYYVRAYAINEYGISYGEEISFSTLSYWTELANFGGDARDNAVGFAIENKIYIGTGWTDENPTSNDFWQYNIETGTWMQVADLGEAGRNSGVCFVINNRAFVLSGIVQSVGYSNDVWEYNPNENIWVQKNDFPGEGRNQGIAFTINNKGYFGTGFAQGAGWFNDFWEYDPSSDTWIQKANLPGDGISRAVGFSVGEMGYVGAGESGDLLNDFWRYDPNTDSWEQMSGFDNLAREAATGFGLNGYGFIGLGSAPGGARNDFWKYDPSTDSWTEYIDFSGEERTWTVSVVSGGKAYIGTGRIGYDGTPIYTNDFWRLNPE